MSVNIPEPKRLAVFKVGGEFCAVCKEELLEVLSSSSMESKADSSGHICGYVCYNGDNADVFDLVEMLKIQNDICIEKQVLIIKVDDGVIGLLVDSMFGNIAPDCSTIESAPHAHFGICDLFYAQCVYDDKVISVLAPDELL